MNLKAIIPSGQTEITVNGLHQWDYGRKLEIHSDELPALIEVHFACSGMTEAVVRSCAVVDGVATADIPDHCIEQTTPIVAWIYCIDDTSGKTERTIIMPIIARTKPAPSPSVPTFVSDKYTELIGAVNEQIGALQDGRVTAAKATKATQDGNGNNIATTYATKTELNEHAKHKIPLLCSVEITNGVALLREEDAVNLQNTFCALVLRANPGTGRDNLFTGVTQILEDISWSVDNTVTVEDDVGYYYTSCGKYTIAYRTGSYDESNTTSEYTYANVYVYLDGELASTVNGTLEFYKLGGISE